METSCGLGGCRPKWLQKFNSTKGFMFVYGLLGMAQAMSYVYFVSTLSTMEKRFKIQSRTTGKARRIQRFYHQFFMRLSPVLLFDPFSWGKFEES